MNNLVWNNYIIGNLPNNYDATRRTDAIKCIYKIITDTGISHSQLFRSVRIMDYLQSISKEEPEDYKELAICVLSLVDMYLSQKERNVIHWLKLLYKHTNFTAKLAGLSEPVYLSNKQVEILQLLGLDLFHYTYYDCVWDLLESTEYPQDVNDLATYYAFHLLCVKEVQCLDIDHVAELIVALASSTVDASFGSYNHFIVEQLLQINPDELDVKTPTLLEENLDWIRTTCTRLGASLIDVKSKKGHLVVNQVERLDSSRWIVDRKLGSGSYGTVCTVLYEDKDMETKDMAVKFSGQLLKKSSLLETVALSKIKSNYIIGFKGYSVDKNGTFNVAMEIADSSIIDWVNSFWNEDDVFKFVYEAMKGVRDMHRHGFVHRDLKPDNMLIINNMVRICDFGMAMQNLMYDCISDNAYTIGTDGYLSPEVLMGLSIIDKSIDIWALGCTLYALFTKYTLVDGDLEQKQQLCEIFSIFGVKVPNEWLPQIKDLGINLNAIVPNPAPLELISQILSKKQMGLFLSMFEYDVDKRITIEQLCNEWSSEDPPTYNVVPAPVDYSSLDLLGCDFTDLINTFDLSFA